MFDEVVCLCGWVFVAPVAEWVALEDDGSVASVGCVCCSFGHGRVSCLLLPPLTLARLRLVLMLVNGSVVGVPPAVRALSAPVAV